MKIDLTSFNGQNVEKSDKPKKSVSLKFHSSSNEMLFSIFTKDLYSNPIGSIVREITSNCFDSHQEAGVNDAVRISFTKENNQQYIQFTDVGMGMSYKRITTVYAEYFNSTKRNDDNQIGGFGIGGKTPLAYNSESFFITTIYNGIKYIWFIYKGQESPKLDLLSQEFTTERNGTTIKVPIKTSDYGTFEYEMLRQLYYFENVVFEDFYGLTNDYKIYTGEHFIYRGDQYSSRIHLCLGRVAYPIDFSAIGLDESKYNVPIALKFNIGDIKVTPSRETIHYTDATIKLIKKKIELAKEELKLMMHKQYNNIQSLSEYYATIKNFGNLIIDKEKNLSVHLSGMVTSQDLIYPKLSAIRIPSASVLCKLFLNIKRMGRKKKDEETWKEDFSNIHDWKNIIFIDKGVKLDRRTQCWLKDQHPHYYFLRPNDFINSKTIDMMENHYTDPNSSLSNIPNTIIDSMVLLKSTVFEPLQPTTKTGFDHLRLFIAEAIELIKESTQNYKALPVPSNYVALRRHEFGKEMYDRKFSLKVIGWQTKHYKTTFRELLNFKGTIVYGPYGADSDVKRAYNMLNALDLIKRKENVDLFESRDTIKFVILNKTTYPFMEHLKNGFHYSEVYNKILMKKRSLVLTNVENEAFSTRFNNLNSVLLNKAFTTIDKNLSHHVTILRKHKEKINKSKKIYTGYMNLEKLKIDVKSIKSGFDKHFQYIENQAEKNKLIKYITIPSYENITNNKDLMELINKVYVK